MSALVSKVNKNVIPTKWIIQIILYNRLFLVVMQFFFNHLIPDHQSDGFQSPFRYISVNSTIVDKIANFIFSGYARWDGQYFLHISTLGYTHENCLAFFPGYPFLLRFPSYLISLLTFNMINPWNTALLSSILTNIVCFSFATIFLYLITLRLFGSQKFAYRTLEFYCLSPATIFFLAPYSEALFSALSFAGIYFSMQYKFILGSIFFGASAVTRSNGLVNIGFLLFYGLKAALETKWKSMPIITASILLSVSVAIFPFLCFQFYAYNLFCFHHRHNLPSVISSKLLESNFTLPGTQIPEWCSHTIPFSYSFVQSKHWNVGFLRYFEFKQLPNFLLSAPVLYIVFLYSINYVKENLATLWHHKTRSKQLLVHQIFRRDVGVFAAHSAFLGVFTFFFAHVQISTRLIGSSSPVIYWTMAWLANGKIGSSGEKSDWRSLIKRWNPCRQDLQLKEKLVLCYCLSYVVIGTALFVNHLPWT